MKKKCGIYCISFDNIDSIKNKKIKNKYKIGYCSNLSNQYLKYLTIKNFINVICEITFSYSHSNNKSRNINMTMEHFLDKSLNLFLNINNQNIYFVDYLDNVYKKFRKFSQILGVKHKCNLYTINNTNHNLKPKYFLQSNKKLKTLFFKNISSTLHFD